QNGLWLGFSQGGVAYFADGRIQKTYSVTEGLGQGRVNGLTFSVRDALCVATESGLSRIKDGQIITLTRRNGLPCDTAHWSIEDDDHSVWLYMACGLVRITRPEWEAWVADPTRSVKTTLFDISDGVGSHSYPTEAHGVTKSSDGRIWFVAFDGVSVIDPRHLPFNELPPPMQIEQIIADGKPYDAAQGLRLPPSVRDVQIDFTALSFVAPEKVRFRVKLEGWDADWKDVNTERKVFYSNLPPRNYRFRVIACNNSGVWNEEGAFLDFSIAPAFYQRIWFRALCVVAFAALLFAFYRLRVHGLRQQERKLRDVVETIPTIAWTALPDGAIDFVNRNWREYSGLSTHETAGSGWQDAVHPEDLGRHLEKWRASLNAARPFESEVRFRRADGVYRWFLVRAVPLRDARGKIFKWYGTSTDIEERERSRQLESELAHINRVSLLGEMTASLAHEINQPITGTIISADACLRWLTRAEPDLDEARANVTRIKQDGQRAAEIIQRLRSFYKKDTATHREPVDVNEVVGEMLVLLRSEANRYSIVMQTELAVGLPKVWADRVQLQQVLMNLMLNGIEAMSGTDGKGELTITSRLDGGQVVVSVSDTGVGLPADKVDQIFMSFFTTKPTGTGMGLSISRSIVESHGGRLWASNNNGRGATFHFSLPIEVRHFDELAVKNGPT
ncbi:MAG TPA: ATP-binding protein, partial [Pyrinomonadaceae bacterium]